jgi:hypothetical protein
MAMRSLGTLSGVLQPERGLDGAPVGTGSEGAGTAVGVPTRPLEYEPRQNVWALPNFRRKGLSKCSALPPAVLPPGGAQAARFLAFKRSKFALLPQPWRFKRLSLWMNPSKGPSRRVAEIRDGTAPC